jgi:hypothetical protein
MKMSDDRKRRRNRQYGRATKSPGPLTATGLLALQLIRVVVVLLLWWIHDH